MFSFGKGRQDVITEGSRSIQSSRKINQKNEILTVSFHTIQGICCYSNKKRQLFNLETASLVIPV